VPFKSEAQRRWMHEHYPKMAARWEAETPPGKLPDHVPPQEKPKSGVKPPKVRKTKKPKVGK
jgi:hypothetical protein